MKYWSSGADLYTVQLELQGTLVHKLLVVFTNI